ncbi:MAG TPA: TIGR03560 family F420-dependent LLM class oxidoreductase [Chloroflexota bacterium]|nr:TIGR03560 family F420-dependent LLM class oxidoreductase [Chloroflexota bacterium]
MTITLADLRVMIEPQEGGTYAEMLSLARRAESIGFGGFFRSDHYLSISGPPKSDATDAWATLAGFARETSTIRIGALVSPMTFRHPSQLAKIVATVDQMSDGRLEVGMGAGWFEKEHVAYGLPFPPAAERMDRLEDALEICTRLWSDGPATYEGRVFSVANAPGHPKPPQRPGPPIIVGGGGPKRTPRLAAQFASEYNSFGATPDMFAERRQRVADACRRQGRDPDSLVYSVMCPTIVGRDASDLRRRSQRRLDFNGQKDDVGEWIGQMQAGGALVGTPTEVAARLKAMADKGCQRFYLQFVPVDDDGMLEVIAEELPPLLA